MNQFSYKKLYQNDFKGTFTEKVMGGSPSPVRQRVAVPSCEGSNPSPPLTLKIMAPTNNMKIKLLLHDKNFSPKLQSIDLPKNLENQILKESKLKVKYTILDQLLE